LDPDRQGELAGEIDDTGLKAASNSSTRQFVMISPSKLKITFDRDYFVRIEGDRLLWDDGEVWKKLSEDDVSSGASDDTSEARPPKKKKVAR